MTEKLESMMFRPSETSDTLMVLLSGRKAGFAMPNYFNMSFSTRKLDANRLYLRDNFGMWYHSGLQGITNDLPDTAAFLREHIVDGAYSRVVMVGVSTGGYAALLLGAMIGADKIHAFGPPTLLNHATRDGRGEKIEQSLNDLMARTDIDPDLFDLQKALARHPFKAGAEVKLYFDPDFDIDAERCLYLKDVPGVSFVECPGTGHQVMQAFLDDKTFFEGLAFD